MLGEYSGGKIWNHSFLTKAVAQRCFIKNVFLKISQNSQENTYAVYFLKNCREKDSGTDVFLWILRNFKNISYRIFPENYICFTNFSVHKSFGNFTVFRYRLMDNDVTLQKQPSRGVLRKRCSENMQQVYRGTLMPECNFNKVALQLYWI